MIGRTFGIFIGLLISTSTVAQNSIIDSLQSTLKTTKDISQRAELLHQLAAESWDYSFDSGHEYARESLNYSESTGNLKGVVQALTDIGLFYYFTGDYKNSSAFYRQAVKRCGDNNFGDYPAYTLTRQGHLKRVQAEFESAHYYNDAS